MRYAFIALLPLGLAFAVGDLAAQAAHAHGEMYESGEVNDQLAPEVLQQIERVAASVGDFATTATAEDAGFRPRLGLIPTMGTHWVSTRRMITRRGFDLDRPEHLMFAPIDGEETLVGVAFAYQAELGEEAPDVFPGELDQWHVHPELSPPGSELTMLHVWFVPSPDGPFAGHNPWLPYMAVGLETPDPERLTDPEDSYRIRALALALAETVGPLGPAGALQRLGDRFPTEEAEARRDTIRDLIPRLEAANTVADATAWNEAADLAVAEWEGIRQAYLDAIPLPLLRTRLAAFYEEMLTGAHGAHGSNEDGATHH